MCLNCHLAPASQLLHTHLDTLRKHSNSVYVAIVANNPALGFHSWRSCFCQANLCAMPIVSTPCSASSTWQCCLLLFVSFSAFHENVKSVFFTWFFHYFRLRAFCLCLALVVALGAWNFAFSNPQALQNRPPNCSKIRVPILSRLKSQNPIVVGVGNKMQKGQPLPTKPSFENQNYTIFKADKLFYNFH